MDDSAPVEMGVRWVVVPFVCNDHTTYVFPSEAPIYATVVAHADARAEGGGESWTQYPIAVSAGVEWTADDPTYSKCEYDVITDGRLVLAYL